MVITYDIFKWLGEQLESELASSATKAIKVLNNGPGNFDAVVYIYITKHDKDNLIVNIKFEKSLVDLGLQYDFISIEKTPYFYKDDEYTMCKGAHNSVKYKELLSSFEEFAPKYRRIASNNKRVKQSKFSELALDVSFGSQQLFYINIEKYLFNHKDFKSENDLLKFMLKSINFVEPY